MTSFFKKEDKKFLLFCWLNQINYNQFASQIYLFFYLNQPDGWCNLYFLILTFASTWYLFYLVLNFFLILSFFFSVYFIPMILYIIMIFDPDYGTYWYQIVSLKVIINFCWKSWMYTRWLLCSQHDIFHTQESVEIFVVIKRFKPVTSLSLVLSLTTKLIL